MRGRGGGESNEKRECLLGSPACITKRRIFFFFSLTPRQLRLCPVTETYRGTIVRRYCPVPSHRREARRERKCQRSLHGSAFSLCSPGSATCIHYILTRVSRVIRRMIDSVIEKMGIRPGGISGSDLRNYSRKNCTSVWKRSSSEIHLRDNGAR